MKKVLVLNGPNLNLLGLREPAQYGHTTLPEVEALCRDAGRKRGAEIACFQRNGGGALIDRMREAGRGYKDGTGLGFGVDGDVIALEGQVCRHTRQAAAT